MYFYVLNIEQASDTGVMMYGKILEGVEDSSSVDASTCRSAAARIRVENICSSVFVKAVEGRETEVREDIEVFLRSKGIEYGVETVQKRNVFYSSMGESVELMKIVPQKKVTFDDFFSDYSEAIITEFGNPVENIVVSRRLRGPCVVRVRKYTGLCGRDIVVESPDVVDFVCNSSLPPIRYATLSVELNRTDVWKYCLDVGERQYCGCVRSSNRDEDGRAEDMGYRVCETSDGLVKQLNAAMREEEIDCVIYHNIPHPVQRRLEMADKVRCDLFVFASGNIKGRDFSILEMASTLGLEISSELGKSPGDRSGWLERCRGLVVECRAMLQIFHGLDVLHLSKEMSEISGYMLNRTLQNLRAERIEYMLLHELYERGYLFPAGGGRREMKYTGGLVLTPETGFYEDLVLLLDFNSLYPSIIQEFNVCFSTMGVLDRSYTRELSDEQVQQLTEIGGSQEQGILPKILGGFVRRRGAVKSLMRQSKSEEERKMLDIRQRALKLTANSVYGCLGFPGSRFCNYTMAGYITRKGRELLVETKRVAEVEYKMKVIYGDTDSIMISTGLAGVRGNYGKALEYSRCLRTAVNSRYRNIEIEVDKVFKKLLLYKKKKYAGLCVGASGDTWTEYKGLDVVRKDFCRASTRTSERVLEILLLDFEDRDVRRKYYGEEMGEEIVVNNGNDKIRDCVYEELAKVSSGLQSMGLSEFVIHNTLSRAPESYSMTSMLPHVTLALRLKEQGMKFEQGDVVCYVIGKGSGGEPVHRRAYHPSEEFGVDYEYYISNQILPSLLRITQVVKNIHPQKIGRIFGVSEGVRSEPSRVVSFLSPCCETGQEPGPYCRGCSGEIPSSFYVYKVIEMIRKEVEGLYSVLLRCEGCGNTSKGHLMVCLNCNTELRFAANNPEFDEFLSNLQQSFGPLRIAEVDEVIRKYMGASEYRRIDLSRYFSDEIARHRVG